MIRALLTLISGATALIVAIWVGFFFLRSDQFFLIGVVVAAVVASYVWVHTASFQPGLAGSALVGALAAGVIGVSARFFGPVFFAPGNVVEGIGKFMTGRLGLSLGAVGGALYWLARGRRAGRTPANGVV
jgi:hypothetical protein